MANIFIFTIVCLTLFQHTLFKHVTSNCCTLHWKIILFIKNFWYLVLFYNLCSTLFHNTLKQIFYSNCCSPLSCQCYYLFTSIYDKYQHYSIHIKTNHLLWTVVCYIQDTVICCIYSLKIYDQFLFCTTLGCYGK